MSSTRQSFEVERYSFVRFPHGTTKDQEKTFQWTHHNAIDGVFLVLQSVYPPEDVQKSGRALSCVLTLEWGKDIAEKCIVTTSVGIVARSPSIAVRYFSATSSMSHRFQVRFRNPSDIQLIEGIVRNFGCIIKPAGYTMPTPQPVQNQSRLGSVMLHTPQPQQTPLPRPNTARACDRGFPADANASRSDFSQTPSSEASVELPPLRKPTPLMKHPLGGLGGAGPRFVMPQSGYKRPGSPHQFEHPQGSKVQRFGDSQTSSESPQSVPNHSSFFPRQPWPIPQAQQQQQQQYNFNSNQDQIHQPRPLPSNFRPQEQPGTNFPQSSQYHDQQAPYSHASGPSQTPVSDFNFPPSSQMRPELRHYASDPSQSGTNVGFGRDSPNSLRLQASRPINPYSTLPTPPPSSSPRPVTRDIMPAISQALDKIATPIPQDKPATTAPVSVPSGLSQKELEGQIVRLIHDDDFLKLLRSVEGVWQRAGFSLRK